MAPLAQASLGYTEILKQGSGGAVSDTPVNACDVSDLAWIALHLTGTFNATVTFEQSNDDVASASLVTNWSALILNRVTAAGAASASTASTTGEVWAGPLQCKWFRVRVSAYTSGTVVVTAFGRGLPPGTLPGMTVDTELAAAAALSDSLANPTVPGVGAYHLLWNGTTWVRARDADADVLSGTTQSEGQLVTRPGDWAASHAPAANTQATASKAAGGAGVRHVCTSISARIVGGTTAPSATTATLNLRDGATGAGTILMSWTLSLAGAIAAQDEVVLSGLNIVGSANTAMTLEFAAASGANTLQSVNLSGYSVN